MNDWLLTVLDRNISLPKMVPGLSKQDIVALECRRAYEGTGVFIQEEYDSPIHSIQGTEYILVPFDELKPQ